MPIKEISSSNNASIKEYRRLAGSRKYRRSAGKLALEGPHLVKEALATGLLPEVVFVTRSFLDSGGEKIFLFYQARRGYIFYRLRSLPGWHIRKPRKR